MPRAFFGRAYARATAFGYTLGSRVERSIAGVLSDQRVFYESFIVFYGYPQRRVFTKLRSLYLETPYARGGVFSYGSKIASTPITVFINTSSRCIKRDRVVEAVNLIDEGLYSLYLSTPLSSDTMTSRYRSRVYKVLRELGLGLDLVYPSYSLVVGKSRLFKDTPYTIWSPEILSSILVEVAVGRGRVFVDNTSCVDIVGIGVKQVEEMFVDRLLEDLLYMLRSRGVVNRDQVKEYLGAVVES